MKYFSVLYLVSTGVEGSGEVKINIGFMINIIRNVCINDNYGGPEGIVGLESSVH